MVYLDMMPLRFGHFRVLITTAMGQFLGAAVATLSGVLIPLLAIVQHHELDSVTQGLIASMELIGIMVGSFVIGKLSLKYANGLRNGANSDTHRCHFLKTVDFFLF